MLCRIGSIDKFSAEFTHKKGFLSSALEQHLAKTARYLITKYAAEPVRIFGCYWRQARMGC